MNFEHESSKLKSVKKLTKIIATIGPASDTPEKISELIDLGVNVFRFNLKHNELSWHEEKIKLVKKIAGDKSLPIGVMIDLQGPEIRTIVEKPLDIKKGQEIVVGDSDSKLPSINITAPHVFKNIKKDQKVIADDGRLKFAVIEVSDKHMVLKAEIAGLLNDRKTFNMPGAVYPMPVLTVKDYAAIKMAGTIQVDFIALSFVRSAHDIFELKEAMKKEGVASRVVSKIETKKSIENLDEIISASDGIMVARGDLGIELPMEQVPFYQKLMIKKCLEKGIPVITATQMLHSMTDEPYPTRAEISDVSNAVYDLCDSVMLSEETAMGKYPLKAVEVMRDTVAFTELQDFLQDTRTTHDFIISGSEEMLCETAYSLYLRFKNQGEDIGGFIAFSKTGRTGKKISRYRAKVPIFVFCPDAKIRDSLTMSFGVRPFIQPPQIINNNQVRVEDMKEAFSFLVASEHVDPDKRYILLYGDNWGIEGGVSTIKIVYPKNLD